MSDYSNITKQIRGSEKARVEAIKKLANDKELYSKIESYILKNSGSKADVLPIVDDAIIVFVKKILNNKTFSLDSHPHAYLMTVSKNLWFNELRKQKRRLTEELDDTVQREDDSHNQEKMIITSEIYNKLRDVLGLLGKNCKEVLLLWGAGFKMHEIADKLGYKDERVVRKKKSICFSQLTNYLNDNPGIKDLLRP
jgi:RNA polymerase sigma factor (sigma-70 family)